MQQKTNIGDQSARQQGRLARLGRPGCIAHACRRTDFRFACVAIGVADPLRHRPIFSRELVVVA